MNPDESFDWNADFDALFDELYKNFRIRFGDEPTAEDLTQETFVRLWREREKFDNQRLRQAAFRIARNIAIDYDRRKGGATNPNCDTFEPHANLLLDYIFTNPLVD